MYTWIWHHLPFGLPGKITGSLLLVGGAVAGLWFGLFPVIEPFISENLLPLDQGSQLVPGADVVDPGAETPEPDAVGPDGEPLDEHAIPYSTDENNTNPDE